MMEQLKTCQEHTAIDFCQKDQTSDNFILKLSKDY